MGKWRTSWQQLTLVRLTRGLLRLVARLGRWEYQLLNNFGRWPASYFSQGVLRFLIVLGFITSLLITVLFKPWRLIGRGFRKIRQPRFNRTRLSMPQFKLRWKLLRPAMAFALLALLIIAPLKLYDNYQWLNLVKNKVLGVSKAAIGDLFSAEDALRQKDWQTAETNFARAGSNFLQAQEQLNLINDSLFVLARLMPNDTLSLAGSSKAMVRVGELSAAIGQDITAALQALLTNNQGKTLTSALADFQNYLQQSQVAAVELNGEIAKINAGNLPEEYQDEFIILRDQAKFLQNSIKQMNQLCQQLLVFLGDTYDQRYLLVFQNNTELRASGGFMGSFATIDFSQGAIKNLNAPSGGTYDTEAGLRVLVAAPQPLQLLNPLWHFWDANWWPHWPRSAEKIMWFYEKSAGPTVDGVISFTPTVLEDLLKILGPVDLTADYGVVITADNMLETVQTLAEQKPEITRQPKRIVGDLLQALIIRLSHDLDQEKLGRLLAVMEKNLSQKQILMYFQKPELQQAVARTNWGGEQQPAAHDYLQVINTNIGGGKSDKAIKQKLYLQSTIRPDGSLVNELTIERQHTAIAGEPFVGARNVDWLRIYVPPGSQLIGAEGWRRPDSAYFEAANPNWLIDQDLQAENTAVIASDSTKIYQENNLTVFANWSMVDPGETAIIRLSYKLPFNLTKQPVSSGLLGQLKAWFKSADLYQHSLLWQKQPGLTDGEAYYTLQVQNGLEEIWHYPDQPLAGQLTDQYYAYIYE